MPQMTEPQRSLLYRLERRAVVFTGAETDEERLAMLQLYTMRYVTHSSDRTKGKAMEWHITRTGRNKARTVAAKA